MKKFLLKSHYFLLIFLVVLTSCSGKNNSIQEMSMNNNGAQNLNVKKLSNENQSSFGSLDPKIFEQEQLFNDISGHWAREDIELLAKANLIKGTAASTFSPNKNITRAEFSALLTRALLLSEEKPELLAFQDVPKNAWYYRDVKLAFEHGIVGGYPDKTFKPNKQISRQELAAMSLKAYEYLAGKKSADVSVLNQFNDKETIQNWARSAVAASSQLGFVKGYDSKFHPTKLASRAEATVILKRIIYATNMKEKLLLAAKAYKLGKYAQVSCVPRDHIHVIISEPISIRDMTVSLDRAYSPARKVALAQRGFSGSLPKPADWDGMTHEFMLKDPTVPGETIEATYVMFLPYGNRIFKGTCVVPNDLYAAIRSIKVVNDNQLLIDLSSGFDKESALNKDNYIIYNQNGSVPVSNVIVGNSLITVTLAKPLPSDSLFYVKVQNIKSTENMIYTTYEKLMLNP